MNRISATLSTVLLATVSATAQAQSRPFDAGRVYRQAEEIRRLQAETALIEQETARARQQYVPVSAAPLTYSGATDGYTLAAILTGPDSFPTDENGMLAAADWGAARGYILGVFYGLIASGDACVVAQGVDVNSVFLVVRLHLAQNPADLSKPSGDLVAAALKKAFPCNGQ